MKCTLMHKNIPILELTISDYNGNIEKHGVIHNPAHLPLGTTVVSGKEKGRIIPYQLNDWWIDRSIPGSRDGLRDALEILGLSSTAILASKCYGLSLSDQYWICPKDSGLRWETVNFFNNDFSKDMGEILFGREPADHACVSLMSPDNTSDGWLRKKWIIADGKRFLMKGGSGVYQQEPFNEVIASVVMRRLNIAHVNYTLTFDGDKPYSLCENFITPETELVPAWRVLKSSKQPNSRSLRDHFLDCCDTLGVPNAKDALGKLLTTDYIIANEDRHWNNFGVLRNAETLEYIGLAPVYDSGTSLWYNTQRVGSSVECKPFRKSHVEQIKLVEDLSWFDRDTLDGLDDEVAEVLSRSEYVDEKRRAAIAAAVMERCLQIEKLGRGEKMSLLDDLRKKQRQVAQTPRTPSDRKQEPEIT